MRLRSPTDHQWAAKRVAGLPARWKRRVLDVWDRNRAKRESHHWTAEQEAHRAANLELLRVTDQLQSIRLPLDADDGTVCAYAEDRAKLCAGLGELYSIGRLDDGGAALWAAMCRACLAEGVEPSRPKKVDEDLTPHLRRMCDPQWWRLQLRKAHARAVEGAAIRLGFVNKARDCYVSNESVNRRQQQNRRNAEMLEQTIARNELGQEYTLAELAAKGTANKAIRRAELMTRISGFERIAKDLGHLGLFFTMTCPSRMHKWRTVKGSDRVFENRKRYDGTTPSEAQRYLARVWARIRAALARRGVKLYGFRIAEPNHDGTPHWHLLVFHAPLWPGAAMRAALPRLAAIVRRYALADSPTEPGARQHRVDFKPIDWERGTAAGYIAKYVAKNIDGHYIEKDLFGNDAITTAARVEAWAATWRIRQFQQVGGPPVTVWRELRRVDAVPDSAPDHLKAAHRAVNRTATAESEVFKAAAWDEYVKAQGGVFCGRKYRIRLAKVDREGTGRYGEQLPAQIIGVETESIEYWTPEWMQHKRLERLHLNPGAPFGGHCAERTVSWILESSRHQWEILPRKARGGCLAVQSAPRAPWTRVNNCTEGGRDGHKKRPPAGGDRGAKGVGWGTSPRPSDGWGVRWAAAGGA